MIDFNYNQWIAEKVSSTHTKFVKQYTSGFDLRIVPSAHAVDLQLRYHHKNAFFNVRQTSFEDLEDAINYYDELVRKTLDGLSLNRMRDKALQEQLLTDFSGYGFDDTDPSMTYPEFEAMMTRLLKDS